MSLSRNCLKIITEQIEMTYDDFPGDRLIYISTLKATLLASNHLYNINACVLSLFLLSRKNPEAKEIICRDKRVIPLLLEKLERYTMIARFRSFAQNLRRFLHSLCFGHSLAYETRRILAFNCRPVLSGLGILTGMDSFTLSASMLCMITSDVNLLPKVITTPVAMEDGKKNDFLVSLGNILEVYCMLIKTYHFSCAPDISSILDIFINCFKVDYIGEKAAHELTNKGRVAGLETPCLMEIAKEFSNSKVVHKRLTKLKTIIDKRRGVYPDLEDFSDFFRLTF